MVIKNILKTASKLSLGLVLILVWGWMWVRADILFPVNTQTWKLNYILTFIGLVSFIFAWDTIRPSRTERELFKVSFLKRFPVFIISAIITVAILFLFSMFLNIQSVNTISQAIGSVNLGIIFLHAFMIAIGEELIFRGWLIERLRENQIDKTTTAILSAVVFAIFHGGMGKSLITLALYVPLGLLFYYIKEKYSPKTNMANAGVHFGWNLFILGFLGG